MVSEGQHTSLVLMYCRTRDWRMPGGQIQERRAVCTTRQRALHHSLDGTVGAGAPPDDAVVPRLPVAVVPDAGRHRRRPGRVARPQWACRTLKSAPGSSRTLEAGPAVDTPGYAVQGRR